MRSGPGWSRELLTLVVRPFRDLCKVSLTFLAIWCATGESRAAAAEPVGYRVRARVDREVGTVDGTMWVDVRVGEGEDHIRLWLYADRLAVPPAAMTERSWRWIYPNEVDEGGIEVRGVRVDGHAVQPRVERAPPGEPCGRDVAGSDLIVPVEPGAPRTLELRLRFRIRVPGRFGRLGRDDGLLSLAAPWYPLVVAERDAFEFQTPHRVEIASADSELLVGGRSVGRGGVVEARVPYLPVAAAPRFFERVVETRGVELVLRSTRRLYEAPPAERRGEAGLIDLAEVDLLRSVRELTADAVDSARALGVPLPERIILQPIPSRTELAATAPQVVLVSDRLFQIFPIDQTLDFHRRALRRALFAHLSSALADRANEPPGDRGWATDLRAVVLVDLDEARRHHGAQTPQELLGVFAFHPAVDQLLYAPQIAFEDTYFAAIEERDPFRDDPVRARRPLSRGRRILEMARDALTEEDFRRFSAMLVHARRPAREALGRAAPGYAERLASWLAATGEPVNYRLGAIRSERQPDGSHRHVIEVFRDGADRIEPVEVLVTDEAGREVVVVWEAAGARGEVQAVTPGALRGVQLDPRHRLPQSPALADGHPRMDDATDLPWRPPILNGFVFNVSVTEGDIVGLVDFALRRRYDLEHTFGLRLERTRAFTGGTLRYGRGVGPKIHTNRRMAELTAGLSFDRLHEGFADGNLGGWRGQLTLAGALNTVAFAFDPREGFWASAALTGGLTYRDDDTVGWTVRGSVRGGMVLPLGLVNALVVVVGGGFTAGSALASELQSLGGSSRLRGLESGEHLGRGAIFAVAEHRWSLWRDLAMNLAHLVWVREIQLAAFAGAGLAFEPVDLGPDGQPRSEDAVFAADVGLGVRFHYEYGGVQPGVLSVDLGLPLARDDDRVYDAEGTAVRRRSPVGFYIGFDQYF